MYQTKKVIQYNFGMKAHIGADAEPSLVHHFHGTAANVADVTEVAQLLHGEENVVCADAGYTGVEKRLEHEGRPVIWQVAVRRSTYKRLSKRCVLYKARRKIEKVKAQARANVEHPFRVIKRQFGYVKTRFRGLAKKTAQLTTLFALSNLWVVGRQLLPAAGEVRPVRADNQGFALVIRYQLLKAGLFGLPKPPISADEQLVRSFPNKHARSP